MKTLSPKIIVADDEEIILKGICEILDKLGLGGHIKAARDGAEALQMIEDDLPELMFLDISMPNKTGWDVLDRLEAGGIIIPTVILTAHDDAQSYREAVRKKSVIEYVNKPFSLHTLSKAIDLGMQSVEKNRDFRHCIREMYDSLNGVINFSDRAVKMVDGSDDEEIKKTLAIVSKESKGLVRMVEKIADVT